MTVFKHDDRKCPTCNRAALVGNGKRGWACVPKRSGCGATWPAGTKAIEDQEPETWRYRAQIKLPDGRKVRLAGTPAINTRAAALKAERDHIERTLNPPKPVRVRHLMSTVFERFLDEYVVGANNKDSEIATKKSAIDCHLGPELGKLFIDEVTAGRIDELASKLPKRKKARGEGTLGAKTIKNVLQTLRKCLRWAKKRDWIAEVPEIDMPRVDEEEIRFLEDAELAALLQVAAKEPMWFAAALLAADAGLRSGELRALRWTDINEVTGKVTIARSMWRRIEGSPKSRKPRTVPLTERAREALKAIKSARLRGPFVLSRADGDSFGPEHMSTTIDRLTRNAKLSDCGWHTLRHTFCTRLAMRGVPPRVIQEWAGHASIATTMRYMHFVPAQADALIGRLNEAPADVPRERHGDSRAVNDDTQTGVVIQF